MLPSPKSWDTLLSLLEQCRGGKVAKCTVQIAAAAMTTTAAPLLRPLLRVYRRDPMRKLLKRSDL